uniref:Uncharacterized protein n=1 Tax=Sphaerodactylus townsendi TaxID=933632 RepID=A0ACB8GCT4_9SAUR
MPSLQPHPGPLLKGVAGRATGPGRDLPLQEFSTRHKHLRKRRGRALNASSELAAASPFWSPRAPAFLRAAERERREKLTQKEGQKRAGALKGPDALVPYQRDVGLPLPLWYAVRRNCGIR